jgi:plasmid stabilization system protein ParE
MTRNEVVFTPEAEEQLAELYRYIEENATSAVALSYTSSVVEYCEGLATFPLRGMTYGPAFELQRTSGVQRSPTPSMMGEFRSLVFFTVVESTRPRYNRTSRRTDTRAYF